MRFSIIIPNYNSEKWIIKLLDNIKNQTYKDYEVIIVDDMSEDKSVEMIKNYKGLDINLIELKRKRYNGGSRNEGVEHAKGEYIIFVDCDDYFYSIACLELINRAIEETKADLIRLPYHYLVQFGEGDVGLHEGSLEELTKSVFVAPWTKCIKRELFVPFPENTLIEDVSQHIEQMDKINSLGYVDRPIIVWNCRNDKQISNPIQETKSIKRIGSWYRIVADLMDLEGKLTKPYCEEHRIWRLNNYKAILRKKLDG